MRDPAGRPVRLHSGLTRVQVRALEGAVAAAHKAAVPGDRTANAALLRLVRKLVARPSRGSELPSSIDPALWRAVSKMILDGVFELRGERGFVSGADALGEIFLSPGHSLADALKNRTAQRGRDALESARAFIRHGPEIVASRIYMYGRGAVSPSLCRALPTPMHVLRLLGMDTGSRRARRLAPAWSLMELPRAPDEWISWRTRSGRMHRGGQSITWKLYVCPTRDSFRAVFGPSVEGFARHHAFQFKIGSGAFALARPDKFVAYFHRRVDLTRCMNELEPRLASHPSHPVPFGAGATPTGMLAWGVDFAPEPSNREEVSWRWWICERLARYLCRAGEERTAGVSPADFALLRLSLDGVSLKTFAPSPRLLGEIASAASGPGAPQ